MKLFISVVFSLVFGTAFAQEGNLVIPMDFENAKVIPKGIRNLRFRGAQFQANDKFDGDRQIVPVGNALNKAVTWNRLLEGKDTQVEKGILKGYLQSKGVNMEDQVGNTTGAVAIDFRMQVPIIGIGITDRMTMLAAIPVITTNMDVRSGFVARQNLEEMGQNLVQDGQADKAYELQYKTSNAIAEKLNRYKYKPLESRRTTRVGDVRLVNKYLLYTGTRVSMALKSMVNLPTGQTTDVNRAVDVPTGDGQWDAGMGLATDYAFSDAQNVSAYFGYLAQLPTRLARRIPEESDSKLSPDIDRRTKMDLGDVVTAQLSHRFGLFNNSFSVLTGVSGQYKGKDRYKGNQFASTRYGWMSKDTAQSMESVHLGLGYSTLPLFRQKKFPVPLESNFTFNRVVSGRNTVKDYLVAFEMAAFF